MSDKVKRYIVCSIVLAVVGWYAQKWICKD